MGKPIGDGDTWLDYIYNETLEKMEEKELQEWNEKVMYEYAKLKTDEGMRFEHSIIFGWLTVWMTDEQRKHMLEQIKQLKG